MQALNVQFLSPELSAKGQSLQKTPRQSSSPTFESMIETVNSARKTEGRAGCQKPESVPSSEKYSRIENRQAAEDSPETAAASDSSRTSEKETISGRNPEENEKDQSLFKKIRKHIKNLKDEKVLQASLDLTNLSSDQEGNFVTVLQFQFPENFLPEIFSDSVVDPMGMELSVSEVPIDENFMAEENLPFIQMQSGISEETAYVTQEGPYFVEALKGAESVETDDSGKDTVKFAEAAVPSEEDNAKTDKNFASLSRKSVNEAYGYENESLIAVSDQRTVSGFEEEEPSLDEDRLTDVKSEVKTAAVDHENLNAMAYQDVQKNILSADSQSAGASSSNFQQMLSRQIQNNVPEFVKAGQVVLRDNNFGVINLELKPQALGNVKISLELSDKVIDGQITVATKEAFEAFRQNLDTLKQAFQDKGFENPSFALNLANGNSSGSFEQHAQQRSSEQFMANRTYGDYASSHETVNEINTGSAYNSLGDYSIDVVA